VTGAEGPPVLLGFWTATVLKLGSSVSPTSDFEGRLLHTETTISMGFVGSPQLCVIHWCLPSRSNNCPGKRCGRVGSLAKCGVKKSEPAAESQTVPQRIDYLYSSENPS
jgi:hypothetical protein